MLHHRPVFHVEPGLGDFIWSFPIVDSCPVPYVIHGPDWYKGYGFYKIANTMMPRAKMVLDGLHEPNWWSRVWRDFDYKSPVAIHYAKKYRLKPEVAFPQEVIDRLPKFVPHDRVLVHPWASSPSRRYRLFPKVDFSGLDIVTVGSKKDPTIIPTMRFHGDFYELARFMLASRGVVCVVSSVFHLARILRVPTICIHVTRLTMDTHPGHACHLLNPTPAEIRQAIEENFLSLQG